MDAINTFNSTLSITVLPVLGNHDAQFVDQEWFVGRSDPFLQQVAHLWSPWLTSLHVMDEFSSAGYYNVVLNTTQWIVLNSLWYDPNNLITHTEQDPGDQYAWLVDVLSNFIDVNVLTINILTHIPPSAETVQLNIILCRFAYKINAIFAAHTHHDHFRLLKCNCDKHNTTIPIYISPSMQTSYHLPSLRIYNIDLKSVMYTQYHLPINQTDLVPSYRLRDYNVQNMQDLYSDLQHNNTAMQLYHRWYSPINNDYCDVKCSLQYLSDILIV